MVHALYRERPGNSKVQKLIKQLQASDPQWELALAPNLPSQIPTDRVVEGPYASSTVTRDMSEMELTESPYVAHLMVPVFWQERTSAKQQIRIHPKLWYRTLETQVMQYDTPPEEITGIALNQFPEKFKKWVEYAEGKVSSVYQGSNQSWKLTIELFVPVQLLCVPLTSWCDLDGKILETHALVVGCSDRFDQTSQTAPRLHNQLKDGWERFRQSVPDRVGSTLRNLAWLTSDEAPKKSLSAYSGFQCYGTWLKSQSAWLKSEPDAAFLKKWFELVQSGIPLALWTYGTKPKEVDVSMSYDQLTAGNRFDLLKQIPIVRNEQRKEQEAQQPEEQPKNCDYYVGVLYEDLKYAPDPPKPQLMAWPT